MSGYAVVPTTLDLTQPFGYGSGYRDFVTLTNPAAGANLTFTVEGRNYVRVLSARATVNTDANVANRFVSLDYVTGRAQTIARNAAGLVLTANTVNQAFEWSGQRTNGQWAVNTPILLPVFPIFMAPAQQIRITIDNIQVGDTITLASLVLERFDVGSVGTQAGFVPFKSPPGAETPPLPLVE